MKKYAESFYKSQAWQNMRDYIYRRDKGLCQDCLKLGMITSAEEVHHIKPITPNNITDSSITLNEFNLIALCRECHRQRHSVRNSRKRYKVDEFGRIVTL